MAMRVTQHRVCNVYNCSECLGNTNALYRDRLRYQQEARYALGDTMNVVSFGDVMTNVYSGGYDTSKYTTPTYTKRCALCRKELAQGAYCPCKENKARSYRILFWQRHNQEKAKA